MTYVTAGFCGLGEVGPAQKQRFEDLMTLATAAVGRMPDDSQSSWTSMLSFTPTTLGLKATAQNNLVHARGILNQIYAGDDSKKAAFENVIQAVIESARAEDKPGLMAALAYTLAKTIDEIRANAPTSAQTVDALKWASVAVVAGGVLYVLRMFR